MTGVLEDTGQASGQDGGFSDRDFRAIADFANTRFGLHLQESKKPLVYSRIARRMTAVSAPSAQAYCRMLAQQEHEEERAQFVSALTTNVTHFFREMHHFDFIRDQLAPHLLEKAKAGKPVRLWSSACSSGQEAYSLGAVLLAISPDFARLDVKILATDIDPRILDVARKGRYPHDQIGAIPAAFQKQLVQQDPDDTHSFVVTDALRAMVRIGELNLIDPWPMRKPFDVIFCRNVAIYFDKPTQHKLWQRFADTLTPGGHLMIGHSERLAGPATRDLSSAGITTYQRRPRHGPTQQRENPA